MKKLILLLAMGAALTSQTLFAQVPSYVPASGLLGYWPFNGNANDESGNGNNGVVNGASLTADRFGNSNNAYNFNGLNNYITINNTFDLAERTFNIWFNPSTINSTTGTIVVSDNASLNNGVSQARVIKISNVDNLQIASGVLVGFYIGCSTTTNNWQMLTYVRTASEVKLYYNGNFVATTPSGNYVSGNGNSKTVFGADRNLLNDFYNGKLDDIGVWNRALSQQEITNMYNGVTYSDTCNAVSGSLTQGLVGYWPFCGNANDDSGNGNNGTVNGAALTTDRFGNANSAYSFNGISSRIEILDSPTLKFQSSNVLSLSYWFKTNVFQSGAVHIQKQDGIGATQKGFNAGKSFDGRLSFLVNNGTGSIFSTVQTNNFPYDNDTWNYVTSVFENGVSKLYVNGNLISTSNYVGAIIGDNIQNLVFGTGLPENVAYFNGQLDDIGIWNRALTQSEVTQLYNQNQCINNITVTDTLIINVGQLSYNNPVSYANNITIAPNPASTQINISFNNITNLNGGTLKVINSLGQEVATTPITTSGTNSTMQLATWGGTGMYFVQIINPQGQIVDIKKIILQ